METIQKLTKGYKNTKFYKSLTDYLATAYAEGFCEGENATAQETLTAYQYIKNHKLQYGLQGFFGRNIQELTERGLIY